MVGPDTTTPVSLSLGVCALAEKGGDSRGVPRLKGRDSVQDPLANMASKARNVVLPGFGRRMLGLPPLPIDVPCIVLCEDWNKVVRQDDVLKGRDERSLRSLRKVGGGSA